MPKHKRMMYDFPFLNPKFEYYCRHCAKVICCIDDRESRDTCGICGSKEIVKKDVGFFNKFFKEIEKKS